MASQCGAQRSPRCANSRSGTDLIKLVSLIICTRNRAEQLRTCLSRMLVLEAPCEWELIVVDNGSSDATAAVVGEYAAGAPIPLRYLREPVAGLSRARNRGIAAARGDAILFTDDDCYPEADYLRAAVAVLGNPRVDYFGGRILLHDPTDAPMTIKTSTEVELIPPGTFVGAGVIHGANMGFLRQVITRIGGFNEGLGAGSQVNAGEDIEYIARASAAGFHGGYFPGPTVSHHHGRKSGELAALSWGYHLGRGAYYTSMILQTPSRGQFLSGWLASLSWRRPRRSAGELLGGLRFGLLYLAARASRRTLIPAIDGQATGGGEP
jgi:GT2 family glycosyltransferase